MNEQRFVVSDVFWQRFEPHLSDKLSDAGATAKDNRLFLEAIFWRMRTGSPWRDLPPSFGHWNSQFRRFRRWAKSGIFESLFNTMSEDIDLEYALIDGMIVQVHQKATGTKWGARLRPTATHACMCESGPTLWRWWMRSESSCASCCCRDKRMI